MTLNPKQKGALATIIFTLFGILGFGFSPEKTAALPEAIMYALLMAQTWYSLPLFFRLIDPKDKRQQAMDIVIGFAYALLAWTIHSGLLFYFAWTLFFILTVLKYSLLVGRFSAQRLLRRKLVANVLGIAVGLFVPVVWLLPVFAAHRYDIAMPHPLRWVGVILFGGACGYYLWLRPLYDAREDV
jgi:cytochrome c oxidase subunit IV